LASAGELGKPMPLSSVILLGCDGAFFADNVGVFWQKLAINRVIIGAVKSNPEIGQAMQKFG
jgi:hypothetical protein